MLGCSWWPPRHITGYGDLVAANIGWSAIGGGQCRAPNGVALCLRTTANEPPLLLEVEVNSPAPGTSIVYFT